MIEFYKRCPGPYSERSLRMFLWRLPLYYNWHRKVGVGAARSFIDAIRMST